MSRNLKRKDRRVARISTSRIRIVTETRCSLSRAKVRVASREPVSNVECEGTRLTDAGRKESVKEEKETGRKEWRIHRKGKWSNPGHTWDTSWYHSNWHGKAYGLEVDPWATVEPVPCLSCEEFSEPKHVRKGHCTNTLKLKKSGTVAHENKFSILASDDVKKIPARTLWTRVLWIYLASLPRSVAIETQLK